MWKKAAIMGIALLGTFSVVYAFHNDLNATSSTYNAGGEVTGRINQAPVGVSGDKIGVKKGDRVHIGIDNPFTSNSLIFQLIYEDSTGWYSMSTESIGDVPITERENITTVYNQTIIGPWASGTKTFLMANTNIAPIFTELNRQLQSSQRSLDVIENRNLSYEQALYDSSIDKGYTFSTSIHAKEYIDNWSGKKIFPIHSAEVANGITGLDPIQNMPLTPGDLMYGKSYHLNEGTSAPGDNYLYYIDATGVMNYTTTLHTVFSQRAAINLKAENIIFGISKGLTNGFSIINEPKLNISEVFNSLGKEMKLRIEKTSLTSSTTFHRFEGHNGTETNKVAKDSTVYLNASAQAGTNTEGVNTVSAIIFDGNGVFKYYKPMEPAKGTGKYALDVTGLPLGTYKIGIVNEVYNENSTIPAYSSKITDVKTLVIVEPSEQLSNLTYTPTHISSGTDYYFSSSNGNVLSSNKVASLSTSNGAGSGAGENGIVYKLQPASSSSNSEDYKAFSIPTESGTDKPILDASDGNPYVIAKPLSGGFLSPGVYQYRVQAYDENGDPVAYETSDTLKANPYAQLNNGTIVKGITPSQGLITEDITTVVYPHESQISYTQLKDGNGEYYKKNDINKNEFSNHLGTLTFNTEANMQKLFDAGYTINTSSSKIMKKGSATEQISALKITANHIDKAKFYMTD